MDWDKDTEEKFNQLLAKIPIFVRDVARARVLKAAEAFAEKENHPQVIERDLVDAFFAETPFGFHGPMKTDMEDIGINYTQYGHEK